MHFGISFTLGIVSVIAYDNLFFDDQSLSNFNLDIGTDSSSDSSFAMSPDLSLFGDANEPFDGSYDSGNDEEWDMWLPSDLNSPEYLSDAPDECSLEPGAASKSRKSRRAECKLDDPAKGIPSGFLDLSDDQQEELYRRLVCPSKTPGQALVPVCSSRLTQNNHWGEQISYPGVWSYTLMDSFICKSGHYYGLGGI